MEECKRRAAAPVFDTHAHYDDEAFREDRDAVLAGLPAQGVTGVVNCAVNLESARMSLCLAERYSFVYAAVGVHPEDAAQARQEDLAALAELLAHPKAVAIGEIGLDYHWDIPRELQRHWLERQLALAVETDTPVIIHDREAHADTLRLLQTYRPRGVVHCFSGSAEMADEIVRLGMYIGLGGAVTFHNARKSIEVAAAVPLSRILLETDCPYMAPVPFRGKRNDSSLIPHAARKIAEIRGIPYEEVLETTEQNAHALFHIPS